MAQEHLALPTPKSVAWPAGAAGTFPRPNPAEPPERGWRSAHDLERRYRRYGEQFVKIGGQNLGHEWAILIRARGLEGVPEPLSFRPAEGRPVLTLKRIAGRRLDLVDQNFWLLAWVCLQAARRVLALAGRGISHNDLRPENVILGDDGQLWLVDFGRAAGGPRWACLAAGLLGLSAGGLRPCFGVPELVRSWVRDRLPPAVVRRLIRKRPHEPAPALRIEVDHAALTAAWQLAAGADASSPGRSIAYYGLTIGGRTLPGERPFASRWSQIQKAVDLRGRRLLELGCNMALLSTFALRESGARAALAVDRDPRVLEAARLVAGAFGVEPWFATIDFDAAGDWEADLAGFAPDLVCALSLANWVRDPARLLAFLARFPEVIFEGHGSAADERRRLLAAGFDDVERICVSERGRTLFRCRGAVAS